MKPLLNELTEIVSKLVSLLLLSILILGILLSMLYESSLLLFKFIHKKCSTKFKKKYIVFKNKGKNIRRV
jgi:Sec-independent protein secretion pathway component TatC